MNHLNEEDLVLHYYGEQEAAPVAGHLVNCEECRARFHELQRALNSLDGIAVPERGEDYGAQVWHRIEQRLLLRPPSSRQFQWQVWGSIAAMIALGITSFWAGRHTAAPQKLTADAAAHGVQQRVLVIALSDHFARSQMVLAEIENAASPHAAATLDVSYERAEAEDLLDANRLYRQTALSNGDLPAAALLEELENTLLEIAHAPDKLGPAEIDRLRGMIEERGVVFKVRVYAKGLSAKGEL